MSLFFFPRGGSAQVARALTVALLAGGWQVDLASGSLGASGEPTHAASFYAGDSSSERGARPGRRRLAESCELAALSGYTRPAVWAWIWISVALVVNGLLFRWLGGFGGAGEAIERWGNHSARRWARRHGMKGL